MVVVVFTTGPIGKITISLASPEPCVGSRSAIRMPEDEKAQYDECAMTLS